MLGYYRKLTGKLILQVKPNDERHYLENQMR